MKKPYNQYIADFIENNSCFPVKMSDYWNGNDDAEEEDDNKEDYTKEATDNGNFDYNLYYNNKLGNDVY